VAEPRGEPGRELLVILNPAAGRGGASSLWPQLQRAFRAAGARPELALTRAPGHAVELAESAARAGWPGVVAVGGDGVVHEVVNGLMRASEAAAHDTALGVIAAGSGNDFVKMLHLPTHHPDLAARRIAAAAPRAVDVGRVDRCVAARGPAGVWYFTNGIGMGFDAQVAVQASRIRRLKGFAIYAAAVLRTLRDLRSPRMRVEIDGVTVADRPLVLATIGNGQCHGGSFWLSPGASVEDGLLDVLVADARSVPKVLALLPRVMRGQHVGAQGVTIHRGRVARVTSEEPVPIHADGELVADGVTELEAAVVAGGLRVLD
jgi:YegS/Rv2252/BmrU family lipid kinase